MATTAGLTYGDVKSYVLAVAGDCCSDTPELESVLAATAQEMWVRLEDCEPIFETTITTVINQPGYMLPCVPDIDGGVTSTFFDKLMAICDRNGNKLREHASGCDLSVGSCCCAVSHMNWDPWCASWQMKTKATSTVIPGFDDDRTITFYPTPSTVETYTLQGLVAFDPTLYVMTGTPPVKEWLPVALPVGLHYAYQEATLGAALQGVDVTRAGLASTRSMQMYSAWKDRQVRSDYVLGSTMVLSRHATVGPYLGADPDGEYPMEIFQKVAPQP